MLGLSIVIFVNVTISKNLTETRIELNMIYYCLFFFTAIVASLDVIKTPVAYKRFFAFFIGAVTVFFSGIRWKTGTDWDPYLNIFSYSSDFFSFMSMGYESLFLLVNFISKNIINSYTFYLFVVAFIVIWCKYTTFFKLSNYPLICILSSMAFYSMDMFTVRQGIAIALTIYSLRYVIPQHESKAKFIITIALASGFHVTALVFLPAIFIFKMKSSINRIIAFTCIAALVSLVFGAADLLNMITKYSPSFIGEKITRYLAMQDVDAYSEIPNETRRALGYAKRIVFVLVFAWSINSIKDEQSKVIYKGMFNLFAFSAILFMLLDSVHPVFSRLAMYYSAAEIFLVSSILFRFKKNVGIFIVYFAIVFYLLTRLVYGFNNHPDLFFPYETIFQSEWKRVY